MKIVPIVEGHSEVVALPLLLRRLAEWRSDNHYVEVSVPIRVNRNRFLNKADDFARHLSLAGAKCGTNGWVLIMLDADDDCPANLAPQIQGRAERILQQPVSVVLPNREFEAWFIGAASSLHGHRGLAVNDKDLQIDPESPRDAKGWLANRMEKRSYGEITDQPALVSVMDLQQAFDRCRSFKKLCSEWDRHVRPRE